ncbi:MAG: hypothetical protein ACRBB0_17735 [Pelagimonas sp.]|uniref:hypothetical protein n=1 Tax=Pelagimonas sp. TaxID=2073170 RepID=UPI003D6AB4FC
MKFVAPLIAAAFALGACQSTTDAPMEKAPTSMIAPLIGKTLVAETGATFVYNADGTVSGEMRNLPVAGVYTINAKDTCTVFSAPDQLKGQEFCSKPEINGNTVVFHRRDGSTSPKYEIKG